MTTSMTNNTYNQLYVTVAHLPPEASGLGRLTLISHPSPLPPTLR